MKLGNCWAVILLFDAPLTEDEKNVGYDFGEREAVWEAQDAV